MMKLWSLIVTIFVKKTGVQDTTLQDAVTTYVYITKANNT